MDITKSQFVECFGYILTLVCVLYCMLNAKKDYGAPFPIQITLLWLVGILGGASILSVVCYKGIKVVLDVRKFNRGEKFASSGHLFDDNSNYSEIKWEFLAVFSILCVPVSSLLYAVTLNHLYITILRIVLPFAIVVFTFSMFFRPRRKDRGYMTFLHSYFCIMAVIPSMSLMIGEYRESLYSTAGIDGLLLMLWVVLYRAGLSFRVNYR